jgi:hypothetical protein
MSSFLNNLFGTIAGGSLYTHPSGVDFIPKGPNGEVINIKGDQATWLGLRNPIMQKFAYDFCFPLASVVDRLAEYDITGNIEILRSTGKGKDNFATNDWAQRMNKLLAQPNPLQSWEQFRGQQVVYKKVFGFCPVLPVVPAGFPPEFALSIINLPPWLFDVEGTKKFLFTSKTEEMIKQYKCTILGQTFNLTSDQVIILEDSFMQDERKDFLLPQSRLIGLDMAISNCCAAMEADNVLLKKKGPLGFITHDAAAVKDSIAGYIPMSKDEKIELQNALAQYGLSLDQYQYVISRTAAKWNPMSFDVKQLGTKETVTASEKAICHRFGYPYTLYEQQDATYANGLNAEKGVYQNNVIPGNTKDLNKYNKYFKAAENQCKIANNYLHIASLQEDALAQANAAKALDDALTIEYNNNLITKNQWLSARGYDTVQDGDSYKASQDSSDPLAMKLGVGGTQALMELLANASLTPESKKNGLIILFGLSPEDANKMLAGVKENPNPDPQFKPPIQNEDPAS